MVGFHSLNRTLRSCVLAALLSLGFGSGEVRGGEPLEGEKADFPGVTVSMPNLQLARQEIAAVVTVDGAIWVAGGILEGVSIQPAASVEVLEKGASAWVYGPDLPTGVDHAAMAYFQGRIWVLGGQTAGFTPYDGVVSIAPGETEWKVEPSLPAARGAGSANVVAGRLVFVGGIDSGHSAANDLFRLSVDGTQWETMSPMTVAREHLGTAVAGGRLYVIGGRGHHDHRSNEGTGANEVWIPEEDRWETLADLPDGRSGLAVFQYGGKVWAAGGELPGLFGRVDVYDPGLDQWFSAPDLNVPRHGMSGVVVDGTWILPGGSTLGGGREPVALVDGFRPDHLFSDGFESGTKTFWCCQ